MRRQELGNLVEILFPIGPVASVTLHCYHHQFCVIPTRIRCCETCTMTLRPCGVVREVSSCQEELPGSVPEEQILVTTHIT